MVTLIRIGLENDHDGCSIAWVLDHPGCFAYGQDGSEALLNVPQEVWHELDHIEHIRKLINKKSQEG